MAGEGANLVEVVDDLREEFSDVHVFDPKLHEVETTSRVAGASRTAK